jgi:hypothetical protein
MKWLLIPTLLYVSAAAAQTGGSTAFAFLSLPFNARSAALGGELITARDKDISSGMQNPAMLNPLMDRQVQVSQSLLAGGINFGSLNYAHAFGEITAAAQFRYVSYGQMKRTDYTGADLGTFSPGDFALGFSAGKSINERMHIGATLNFIFSQLDSYTAFGNSIDIGGAYTVEEKNFALSGVIKNLGYQWKGYTTDVRSPLPLELQLGVSKKLEHAPFRFSVVAQQLQRWDLTYDDPNAKATVDPLTGDSIAPKKTGFIGKAGRHLLFQAEIIAGKRVHFRVAYDVNRRAELKLAERGGISGFSFGAGLYFKRFNLDYGLLAYSVAGYQHQLSLTIPLKRD